MELVGEARASKSRALLCKLLERHNTLRVEEEALRAQEGAIQTAQKQVQELQTVVQGRRCYGEEELKTELIQVLNSKKRIIRAHQDSSNVPSESEEDEEEDPGSARHSEAEEVDWDEEALKRKPNRHDGEPSSSIAAAAVLAESNPIVTEQTGFKAKKGEGRQLQLPK